MSSSEFSASDSLLRMLTAQARLQREAYGRDLEKLTVEERVAFIKDMVLAATDELHEALNEVSWKPWANGAPTVNEDAFFGELVDVVHFIMNLMLVAHAGAQPEDVWRRLTAKYTAKNARNLERQREGYDGVTGKCPRCRRALDDEGVSCERLTESGEPYQFRCAVTDRYYWPNGDLVTA